jgi:ABC-type nickel/cobalt efflux system permease component RcnA
MMQWLVEANRYFNTEISTYFESINEGGWPFIATIFAFSFAYGLVHALGPGHGKALLSGYLLAHPKLPTSHIFRIGFFIALVHALSALALTLIASYAIHISATKLLRDVNVSMVQISGGLIVLMGCWLLYEVLASRRFKEEKIDSKKELGVIILSGIVPCPGVMTLTFFAITLGELSIGIIAALFMSLGMGLTISVVGLLAHRLSSAGIITRQPLWFLALRIVGTLIVIGIGFFLLSHTNTKPF